MARKKQNADYSRDYMTDNDRSRGPEVYPHWHDAREWAKHTTITREQIRSMTPERFADLCQDASQRNNLKAFFYAIKWPEGETYCLGYCATYNYCKFAHGGLVAHQNDWPSYVL